MLATLLRVAASIHVFATPAP